MDALRKQKFNQAMFSKNRTLAIRVGKYQSSDIKEASFDYGYIKGDAYKPGGTCAGSAKIVFTSIITTFNKLDKVYPEVGLLVDGTYEWVKMGEYFINDIEIDRNRNTTKLDLMDGMFKLNREHVTDLSYPAEIRHVIKEICLKTGITLANEYMDITSMNYRIEHIPKDKKMTFRDVLSLASQMLGMSCFFNREGKLEVKELTDSGIVITADSYFMHGLTKSEIEYQIAGITCKKDKETLTVGLRTGRSLEIENLLMSQSALDNLYHNIKDIRYYPFNLNYQGHLLLDVGQWVAIKTNTGETFKSPILSQSFTFKGGLRGRISADSKAGNDAQYSYAGTITKKIEQFNEIEAQIQSQLEEADKGFDQKVEKIKNDFSDQVELAKAKTEEVKRELSDTINQRFDSFENGPLQDAKRRAIEALQNAGASSLLAQEAKRISLDSISKLEAFKSQATSAQTALSGDLDALKRTVTSEVNQASEYRRTTTEALSRMTGQMNGFATKSEVAQGIDGLTQTFAKMKVGGRNLWIKSKTVGAVIEKLPENHVTGQKECYRLENNSTLTFNLEPDFSSRLYQKVTYSAWIKFENVVQGQNFWNAFNCFKHYLFRKNSKTGIQNGPDYTTLGIYAGSSDWKYITFTYDYSENQNFDQLKTSLRFNLEGATSGTAWVTGIKVEIGSVATDYSPALEDEEAELLVAKTEFKKTAEGLSTKIAAVESYVGQDGQRQEALRRYTREESARQATAVRELVTRDYVGKASHQEDVRAIERKFEAITNPQNGSIATQIATYRNAVDGRFAHITSLLSSKANQTDFQRVKETSLLYERILGNTNNSIADNVARMAMTSQLFQVEVAKNASNGQNLLKGTKSFSGDWKNMAAGWKKHSDKYQGCDVLFKNNSWNGIGQEIDAKIGEIYTFSLWMKSDWKNDTVNFYVNKNGSVEKGWGVPSETSVAITSEWKRYSFTFKITANGFIFPRVERLNQNTNLYVAGLKLEKGSYATPYTEAPEDTDEAVRSVQSQLAGSWAVQNINSAGDIISGINLGADGINRFIGKTFHITGETLIDRAVIKSAMVDKLKTANFEAGSVTTVVLDAEAVTAEKLKVDQAFFNKLVANEAYLNQLFAKQAFINRVQSVAIDASQVRSGILSGDRIYGGTIRGASIYGGTLTGHTQIQLGSYGSFDTVNGGLQINVPRDYNAKDGLGVQFIGSYGRGENVPYGLFIYKDSDFTTGGYASKSDDFLLTVEGYIKANGIGWFKTGKGSIDGSSTATIGYWNSSVSLDFGGSGNDIYYSYNGKAYSLWTIVNQHFSDRRLKENIVECKHKALDYIQQFQFKEYDWKIQEDRPQQAHTKIGLIAQEVQEVDPTLVYENGDTLNLDNLRLTNIALKAIQELSLENRKLTHRLENLENERRTA